MQLQNNVGYYINQIGQIKATVRRVCVSNWLPGWSLVFHH